MIKTNRKPKKTSNLPNFSNPPVVEVVCGAQFSPLDNFAVPHFGLLWQLYQPEYPYYKDQTYLPPALETFPLKPPQPMVKIGAVPPRVWFCNADESAIVQVQRDRFLTNWKKSQPSQAYPRYGAVRKVFDDDFQTFQSFVEQTQLGTIEPTQYELTYINHIPQGDGWHSLEDLPNIFPDLAWRKEQDRFLPSPEIVNWTNTFLLPENSGRLHMAVVSANRIEDDKPVIQFSMTVRGIGEDKSLQGMDSWFNQAREWIVRSFVDMTSIKAQTNVWGLEK